MFKRLGWQPDLPDKRDEDKAYRVEKPFPLPPSIDMRPKCPPIYDQGDLGCHCEKTEVLTENGWRGWTDYDGKSLLGTMNPLTHRLEFQAPTALQRFEYKGLMYNIEHRSLDFSLTPNHRMYLRKWDESHKWLTPNYSFEPIENIGWYAGLPYATTGYAGTELTRLKIGNQDYAGDDFVSLIALIISDGWVSSSIKCGINRLSFCCFNPKRVDKIKQLAQKLELHEMPGRPGVWMWNNAELSRWLKGNAYTSDNYKSPFKAIPPILKCCSERQIKLFLDFYGDQHIDAEGNQSFYSSSKRIIDDLQELLLRVGKRASIYERGPRTTTMKDGRIIHRDNCTKEITLVVRKTDRLSIDRKKNIYQEDYNGEVFCATVPNSLLITRKNNKVLISGNSCTGFGVGFVWQYMQLVEQDPEPFHPSELFIYYNERMIERCINEDAGAQIRDGIKSIVKYGVVPIEMWPYDTHKFADRPPISCYMTARKNQALAYSRVPGDLLHMKSVLAMNYPIVLGISVYDSFMSDAVMQTGIVPMPDLGNESLQGGHCVAVVGYDDNAQQFIMRNSWSVSWGQQGYFTIPYDYLTDENFCDDRWIVRQVEI